MNKQRGDVTVVVTVLIAVVLLAAVGWVAYSKFYKSSDDSKTTESKTASQDNVSSKELCAPHEKLCLSYPSNWKANVTEAEYPGRDSAMAQGMRDDQFVKTDKVVIESPTSAIQVSMITGVTGIGGTCSAADEGIAHLVEKKETALTGNDTEGGLVTTTTYAVKLVRTNKDKTKFWPVIALSNSSTLLNDNDPSACAAQYLGLISGRNITQIGGGHGSVELTTGRSLNDSTNDQKSYASMAEAEAFLKTAEAVQAFDIVASAKYQ